MLTTTLEVSKYRHRKFFAYGGGPLLSDPYILFADVTVVHSHPGLEGRQFTTFMAGKHSLAVAHSPDTGTVAIVPGAHGVHVRPSPRCPCGQALQTIRGLRAGQLVSLLHVHAQ